MASITKGRLVVLVLFGAVGFWATRPGTNGIKLDTCEPDGFFSRLSLSLYKGSFWQAQLDDVRRKIAEDENWEVQIERLKAKANSAVTSARRDMEALYQKYPELAPSAPERAAEGLRARADQIENAEGFQILSDMNQKQLLMLRRCEAKIRSILGE